MADDEEQPSEGRMRFQDGSTTPREPTLAEQKAREQAERRREEAEREQAAVTEKSRKKRKRILIGTGVTVGVVAVIAVGYAVAQPDRSVEAQCVDEDSGVVVDDANCVTPARSSSGGSYHGSGGGIYPIFIGNGGRQHRYNYGGSGSIGQRASGGTAVVPKESTRVTTRSGRPVTGSSGGYSSGSASSNSGSVSRGGLGVSRGGSAKSGSSAKSGGRSAKSGGRGSKSSGS